MNQGALIWLIIFAVSTSVFFAIAAIVAVRGFKDLFALLDLSAPSSTEGESKTVKSR